MSFRVIDTETCGFNGGVVEIASVDVVEGVITQPMSDLVCPDREISPQAMAVHQITEEMVEGKPRIAVAVRRYQGHPYYVAHNAAFDRAMLPEMNGQWICTVKLAREVFPGQPSYSLQNLRHSLNLDTHPPAHLHPHRALYDCYVTASLLIRIQEESGLSAEEMLAIAERPTLLRTLKFGKYRGQKISEIASQDPGYLRWMLREVSSLSADMKYSLNYFLDK
ncbi:exodeoxyribonuclease X [Rouxiella badensis]|jgi:exodeoxyribonuclease X|uniref:Exodeoxyribonuclease X n=1 Tax=Rouxiella badensis TaxID=1646377 RepID=A0A1X0WGJ6_9GAMM|nr:exodeoxyribonuclease X [Rouxiella badensis]MCC3701321.1 exodeoxyribonuclease X [Rouxiella badensis]MCC3717748.1 exodeoxyribonuclease X [Rouxiella badensis]MCC3727308.1 exodeoxyribonuclease X [Rouxiella badensis]MCC3734999.1 exodeoxyribonuclease X [Rouxiella badensis]MCC3739091.1 exodeoxyribonuclease X [Rouxiella badensis]